jgi:hypothetical protein
MQSAGDFGPAGDRRADQACFYPEIVCTFGSGKEFSRYCNIHFKKYTLQETEIASTFLLSPVFKCQKQNNTDDGSG